MSIAGKMNPSASRPARAAHIRAQRILIPLSYLARKTSREGGRNEAGDSAVYDDGMPPIPTPLRRGWFRYSLMSLMAAVAIAALLSAGIARDLDLIRTRKEALQSLRDRRANLSLLSDDWRWALTWPREDNYNPGSTGRIPIKRRILGDETVFIAIVKNEEDATFAKDHFPEAAILVYPWTLK
jgi:hypothetical protein